MSKHLFYVMNADGSVRTTYNMTEFHSFMEDGRRLIAYTGNNNIHVSTAFLGIDHNFYNDGPPVLFETMIFGGWWDSFQTRYHTYAEAMEGHKMACALAFEPEKTK